MISHTYKIKRNRPSNRKTVCCLYGQCLIHTISCLPYAKPLIFYLSRNSWIYILPVITHDAPSPYTNVVVNVLYMDSLFPCKPIQTLLSLQKNRTVFPPENTMVNPFSRSAFSLKCQIRRFAGHGQEDLSLPVCPPHHTHTFLAQFMSLGDEYNLWPRLNIAHGVYKWIK